MVDLLNSVAPGVSVGCVFALVALGLVLTYKTSGVFNLAFGAQAFVSAAVFYELRIQDGWPLVLAAGVALVVIPPIIGWVLDRILFRHLRTASALPKLVSSLGLLVALPAVIQLWAGSGAKFGPPSVAPGAGKVLAVGEYAITADQITTIVATVAVASGLSVLFRFTDLGLQMRALVESPRLVELAGVPADRVGSAAWVLSSLLAGLAGVLLAPLFGSVSANNFTVLIVAATAAAAFGRLSSMPLTVAGGVGLGLLQQVIAVYLPANSVVARGLRPSLPFAVLFVLLLFWPGLRQRRELTDPLSGVDPPPPAMAATYQDPRLERVTRLLFVAFLGAVFAAALFVVSPFWLFVLTQGIVYTTIFLSVTVLTGMGGQISLCQATFAGVGTFTAAQVVERTGASILLAMVVGALVAAAVGALVALPALRLGGVYLALATLAFALMVENVLFPQEWLTGGQAGVDVPRPILGPIDFADDRAFFLLAFGVFAAVGYAVVLMRRGTTGRFLAAMRGSEVAASAIGIGPVRAKVTVFAVSAAIAGIGGTLLASLQGGAGIEEYGSFTGLFWVVLVVTLGVRTVDGAVNAGMAFILFPEVLDVFGVASTMQVPLQFAAFGFGAVTFARHPEGIVEAQKRRSIERINAVIRRRAAA